MSYVIDAASKIQERQLEAVTKGQESVLKLVKKVAELAEGAPKAPEQVQNALSPVTGVLGSPADYVRFIAESSSEWTSARLAFQDELVQVLAPAAGDSTADTI